MRQLKTRPIKPLTPPARLRTLQELGLMFRAERKRQGLTLQALYEATGLSTRFLSQFERGQANVSLAGTLRALEALGLEMVVMSRSDAARSLPAQPQEDDSDTGSSR